MYLRERDLNGLSGLGGWGMGIGLTVAAVGLLAFVVYSKAVEAGEKALVRGGVAVYRGYKKIRGKKRRR